MPLLRPPSFDSLGTLLVLVSVGAFGGRIAAQDAAPPPATTTDANAFFAGLEKLPPDTVVALAMERLRWWRGRPLDQLGDELSVEIVAAGTAARRRPELSVLRGEDRLRWVEQYLKLSRSLNDTRFAEWFVTVGAPFLLQDLQCREACKLLDDVERDCPAPHAYLLDRLLLLAQARKKLKHYSKAIAALDRAEQSCEDGDHAGLARISEERADLYAERGMLDKAMAELRRAEGHARESKAVDVGALLTRRLDLLLARGQFAAVREEVAGRDSQSTGKVSDAVFDLYAAVALCGLSRVDPTVVADAQREFLAIRDATGLKEPERRLVEVKLLDLAVRTGDSAEARRHLDRALELGADAKLMVANQTRVMLWSKAGEPELREQLVRHRTVVEEMFAEWDGQPIEPDGTGLLHLDRWRHVFAELVALISHLDGDEAALEPLLGAQLRTTLSRMRGAAPLDTTALRALLPEGHGVLVILPAWNESHVFAIDRAGVVRRPVAGREFLTVGALRRFRSELVRQGVDDRAAWLERLESEGRSAARELLPEACWDRMRGWKQLTVVGGGLLDGFPLECLVLEDGSLLGERYAVNTIASLPLAARLAATASEPRPWDELSARAWGTLRPSRDFCERNGTTQLLDVDDRRWQSALAALPAADTEVWVDENATVSAVRGEVDAALHLFLAHGEPPGRGVPPALGLYADDAHPQGLLRPSELRQLSFGGAVVLCACSAAQAPLRAGDDDVSASLVAPFLERGATAVVASRRPMRYGEYLDLLGPLVGGLGDGLSMAEALRRARVQAAGADRVRAFRLGQIQVFGWGQVPIATARAPRSAAFSSNWVVWLSILGVGAAAGLALLGRRLLQSR